MGLVSVLALIPVFLYKFGKEYFGNLFGIVLAVLVMFQQRNAIALSFSIASVNPKLLATEELILLGIVLVTLLFFRWMKAPDFITIFILGGIIGALSLVRLNPIFITPVIVLFIIIRIRKIPKLLIKQGFLFSIGFILIFSPWLFTGVDSEGRSWFLLKIQDVIQRRYPSQSEGIYPDELLAAHDLSTHDNDSSAIQVNYAIRKKINATVISPLVKNDQQDHLAWTMFNHFLHNYPASLLALPDSITIDSLRDLSKREYWQDKNQWNGHIPAGQYLLILVNIFVISIGISVSWRKYQIAGMVPLIVFFAYNLSLGAAINSGSRYIVPINWIVFFYYALGLVIISQMILSFLGIKTTSLAVENELPRRAVANRPFKAWFNSVALLVLVALMLPIANFVVPELVRSEIKTDQLLSLARTIEPEDHQLISGVLLYPYYHSDGTISFVFVDDSNFTSFTIPDDHLISTITIIPESGMPALISIKDNNGEVTLKSIYVEYEDLPNLYWQSGES